MGKIFFFVLRLFGWKIDTSPPQNIKKCVVAMGPHTSNWDFIIGRIAFSHYGVKARFLIKKELFFPPMGWILKAMGGIPVDRDRGSNLTEQAVQILKDHEEIFMVFTPEGTRKYNSKWKKGFYFIAQKAEVPIYIAYVDYKSKTGGFDSLFIPTGDVIADILEIKRRLAKYLGKFPENGIKVEA